MNQVKRILSRARGLIRGLIAWEVELSDGAIACVTTECLLNGDAGV